MKVVNNINNILSHLKGTVKKNVLTAEPTSDTLYIKLSLIGNNKVDVAYKLEQMVNKRNTFKGFTDSTRFCCR